MSLAYPGPWTASKLCLLVALIHACHNSISVGFLPALRRSSPSCNALRCTARCNGTYVLSVINSAVNRCDSATESANSAEVCSLLGNAENHPKLIL